MFADTLRADLGFLLGVALCVGWARWRTRAGPDFPGPCPVGALFKAWLLVIWGVGALLPIAALVAEGTVPGVRLALLPYLALFAVQIGVELLTWKAWRSPVWVIVPCLFLPWRLYQVARGLDLPGISDAPLTLTTLRLLFALWVVNIGVHYSNIVNTLRWDRHPAEARFPGVGTRA